MLPIHDRERERDGFKVLMENNVTIKREREREREREHENSLL